MSENIIIFDWLSFTSRSHNIKSIVSFLGLDLLSFENIHGMYGFHDRLYSNGISIHYNNDKFNGVWVEFSGQGCRAFETYSKNFDFMNLLLTLTSEVGYNITRLDVAYDDKIGILNLNKISDDLLDENYVSKFHPKSMLVTMSSGRKGITVGMGSKKSKTYFRIYDKAYEQNKVEDGHWVRFEIQLRDDNAYTFASNLRNYDLGYLFKGVIKNYVRFVVPNLKDTNKRRWSERPYWIKFISNVERISIYTPKQLDYNLKRCGDYVLRTSGNANKAYIDIVGVDEFLKHLLMCRPSQNLKYKCLVNEHHGNVHTIQEFLDSRGAL